MAQRVPRKSAVSGMLILALHGTAACRRSSAHREELAAPTPDVALRGIADRAKIRVRLETDAGEVHCELDGARAPNGAALFVGLATGRAPFLDPTTAAVVHRPLYDGRLFFRNIPGVYVQTGCPVDHGTGSPGYRIRPEADPGDAERLAAPGALVLIGYVSPPNRADPDPPPPGHTIGSQFIVTLSDLRHLAGSVTALGRCDDLDVVRRIASRETPPWPSLREVVVEGVTKVQ
jgi:peptidyl-prolyl cis-trans isomerase A (cyclophilin A)